MNRLPFLSQRILNTPLMIHPHKASIIIGALAERLGIASLSGVSAGGPWDDDDDFNQPGRDSDRGYDTVAGIAVIPVTGTLVQKLGGIRPFSGMTGYDTIRSAFLCALEDPAAKAILLDIDSPGGEVAGVFSLVDEIVNARGVKPITAALSEVAYSAAYAIASASDRITVPATGGTGSIGIVCIHCSFAKALSGAGIEVTLVQYGARKTDGAPEKALSDEALARFQADINFLGEMFIATVARNRGLSPNAVREMEAGTFLGAAGVAAGLADIVLEPDAAFRELLSTLA